MNEYVNELISVARNESILPTLTTYQWLSNKDFKTYKELDELGALCLELNFPQIIYFFKGNYLNPFRVTFEKVQCSINLKIENEHLDVINKSFKLNSFKEFGEFNLIKMDGLGSVLLKFHSIYKNKVKKVKIVTKAHRDIHILRNDVVKNKDQVLVLENNFKKYRNV